MDRWILKGFRGDAKAPRMETPTENMDESAYLSRRWIDDGECDRVELVRLFGMSNQNIKQVGKPHRYRYTGDESNPWEPIELYHAMGKGITPNLFEKGSKRGTTPASGRGVKKRDGG